MTQETIDVEDGAIPEGWEPERIRIPKTGDTIAKCDSQGVVCAYTLPQNDWVIPQIIIRRKYHPGIDCIPKGWWVWRHQGNWIASQVPNEDKGPRNFWLDGLQHAVGFVAPTDEPRQIK